MVSPTEFYASINNSTYSEKLRRHLYSLVIIQVVTAMAHEGWCTHGGSVWDQMTVTSRIP